ncbi:tumor necrosis factor receptor superfamily member 5-like isoform X1 [Mytilus edulis]|uniref:tumor necrosis factor receptor superfamily member 5-like isoform X1 n=1 Tax=Mytilus edulis TaxID=6550 RepID=UPI0039EE2261
MKIIFSSLIKNYKFSPGNNVYGRLFFLSLLGFSFCYINSSPSYERGGKVCYYCSPGFYWSGDCWTSHTQAQCQPCPYGTFQTTVNIAHYCERCKNCEEVVRNYILSAIITQCTSHSNTICGCTAGYHFVKDHGGNGIGFCYLNKLCHVGYGLVENGSHFEDTKCRKCLEGSTYSSSESIKPCLECTRNCPNGTHMQYLCNTTHDMACEVNKESEGPIKENIKMKGTTAIAIGTVCGVFLSVIIIIIVVTVRRRSVRLNSNITVDNRSVVFMASVIPLLDELKTESQQDDDRINWEKFFNRFCSDIDVLPDWEHFIRTLFSLSGLAEKGHQAVNEAKEAYDQEQYRSRLYYALIKWKNYNYDDSDSEKFRVLCQAVNKHKKGAVKICI